jgi:fibronectin-binding autotransporter adhesin
LTPSGSTFNFGGGGGTLTIAGNLSGSANSVNVGSNVVFSGTNTYGGSTTINGGVVEFSSSQALGGSGASLSIAGSATVAAGYPIDQASFVGRISPSSSANAFTIALATSSSNPLDFSATGANLTVASLGAIGTQTYSGTLTPSGSTYRLGGGGGTLDVTSNLTGADSLLVGSTGPGTVVLSGTNTYGGGTTVASGTLEVLSPGALPAGGSLIIGANAAQVFGARLQGSPLVAESLDLSSLSPRGLNSSGLTGSSASAADSPAVLSATSPATSNPVPEPNALLLLLAAGGCGLLWRVRRSVV